LQSRLSDLGAALSVSLEVTRHWNAPYYRHNRPVEPTGHSWFSTICTRLTTQYDLEIAPASCIKKVECFGISDRLRLTITGTSRRIENQQPARRTRAPVEGGAWKHCAVVDSLSGPPVRLGPGMRLDHDRPVMPVDADPHRLEV